MGKRFRVGGKHSVPAPRNRAIPAGEAQPTAILNLPRLRMSKAEHAWLNALADAGDMNGLLSALAQRPAGPEWELYRAYAFSRLGRRQELGACVAALTTFGFGISATAYMEAEALKGDRNTFRLELKEKAELARIYERGLSAKRPHTALYLKAIQDWRFLHGERSPTALLRRAYADWPNDRELTLRYARDLLISGEAVAALDILAPRIAQADDPEVLWTAMEAFYDRGAHRLALAACDAFAELVEDDGQSAADLRDFLAALAGEAPRPPYSEDRLTSLAAAAIRASVAGGRPHLGAWDCLAVAVAGERYPDFHIWARPAYGVADGEIFSLVVVDEVVDRLLKAADLADDEADAEMAARLRCAAAMVRDPGSPESLLIGDLAKTGHPAFVGALVEALAAQGHLAEAVATLADAEIEADTEHLSEVAAGLMRQILTAAMEGEKEAKAARRALGEHVEALQRFGDALWEQMEYGDSPEGQHPTLAPLYDAFARIAEGTENFKNFAFKAAYHRHNAEPQVAARWYRAFLKADPDNTAALNNLLMLTEDDLDAREAADLAQRLYQLKPDAKLKARLDNLAARASFQATALARWPSLDQYKRRILAALTMIQRFTFQELAKHTNMEPGPLRGHWARLVELGMILESADGAHYTLNPVIRPLVERENSHSLALRIVRGGGSDVRVKPVFNSGREYQVYRTLLQVFPNMLVFPNISLQAIMPYAAMKSALSRDEFGYYLNASADYGIVSTATYLPIVCIELDSPWHDTFEQAARDARKDRIFASSGIPLVRLRIHGDMSDVVLHHEVVAAVAGIEDALRDVVGTNPFAAKIVREVEVARVQGRWDDA